MKQPPREELIEFIDIFNKLSRHEAQIRFTHGHLGLFHDQELPIPAVVNVYTWLKELADYDPEANR